MQNQNTTNDVDCGTNKIFWVFKISHSTEIEGKIKTKDKF